MSLFKVKGIPYKMCGINVEDCKTNEEVIIKAGLNYEVDKCQIVAKMPKLAYDSSTGESIGSLIGQSDYVDIDNTYCTYRTDTNIPFAIVKGRYEPVQNIQAFNFFDEAIGANQAIFQNAGYFGRGHRIFVSVKLPDTIEIGGKDPVDNYLIFTNGHDGKNSVQILYSPVRVTCQNTLNAAIGLATNYISFKHDSGVNERIISAIDVINITKKKMKDSERLYNKLYNSSISDEDAQRYLAKILLSESEYNVVSNIGGTIKPLFRRNPDYVFPANISSKKLRQLIDSWDYYNEGAGQQEIVGTKWGAYNAITGLFANVTTNNTTDIKRFDTNVYGVNYKTMETALELAVNLAINN